MSATALTLDPTHPAFMDVTTPPTTPSQGGTKRSLSPGPDGKDEQISAVALSRVSCPGSLSTEIDSPVRRMSVKSPATSPEKRIAVANTHARGPIPSLRLSFDEKNLPPLPFSLTAAKACSVPAQLSLPAIPPASSDPFVSALLACDFEAVKRTLHDVESSKILSHLKTKLKKIEKNSQEKAVLARVIAYYEGLRNNLEEKKKLIPLEALRISLFVEKKLQQVSEIPEYIPEKTEGMKRALIFQGKTFYVLSGAHSSFHKEGEERKVANAAQFRLGENSTLESRQLVHIENIVDDRGRDEARLEVASMKKQAELAQILNGDIYVVVAYTTKGMSQLVVIEDKYRYTLEDIGATITLSPAQLTQILLAVGSKLQWMHTNGYVHADLKGPNILLDPQPDGSCKIKLTDFGYTFNNADMLMPEQLKTMYGTTAFTAPEFFLQKSRDWTVEEGKRHDMYALGALLYLQLYNLKDLPWVSEVARKVANGHQQQKAHAALIADADSCTDPVRKKLLTACVGLLIEDPKKRLTIERFLQSIQ